MLAVLLFHSVEQAFGEARQLPVRLASTLVAVYPVYNAIKRSIKAASWFAASSFPQNSAEWAFGFLLGLSSGVLHSALTSSLPDPSLGMKLVSCKQHAVAGWRHLCGVLLICVSLLVAVLFGSTWDNTSHRTSADHDDVMVLVGLIAIMILVVGAGVWTVSNKKQTAELVELAHRSARSVPSERA